MTVAALALPDFIIGGAARSGTTWMCRLLERHPSIALAQPIAPEPKFFLVDDLYGRGLAYYSDRWFASTNRPVRGEKSTNYLDNPVCAERIASALPSVKLIFALRDPVERAYSNYRWSRLNGYEKETFETALMLDSIVRTSPALCYARPFDYLERGRYAELLLPYFLRFGAKRIMLVRFEDIEHNPRAVAADLHRFLGVAERAADADALPPVNRAGGTAMSAEARRFLNDYYARPNEALQAFTGVRTSDWSRRGGKSPP